MRTKLVEDAGKFIGDIARPCDHHALGEGIEMEHFIRGDAMLGPRKMGYDWPSAGCDQDFAGGDRLARAEQHLMRPGDGRPLAAREEEHTIAHQSILRNPFAVSYVIQKKTRKPN